MSCCVYKCQSRSRKGEKVHLFSAKNDKQLEEWRNLVPRRSKPLTYKSQICHKHFSVQYIVKDFEHNINGEVVKIPRGRWTLLPDAIPERELFPPNKPFCDKASPPRNAVTTTNFITQHTPDTSSGFISDNLPNNKKSSVGHGYQLESEKCCNILLPTVHNKLTLNNSDISNPKQARLSNDIQSFDGIEPITENDSWCPSKVENEPEDIFDGVDRIDLPTTQWSLFKNHARRQLTFVYHEQEENGNYFPSKQLLIEQESAALNQCSVKIFVRFEKVDLSLFPNIPLYCSNMYEIKNILNIFHKMVICCGAKPNERFHKRKYAELCSLVLLKENNKSSCKSKCKFCQLLYWANVKGEKYISSGSPRE